MSLYNVPHGVHPTAPLAMGLLELSPDAFGRFRDAWVEGDDDAASGLHVIVLTRNGGPNREAYLDVFKTMSERPDWVTDWDDDYDNTYAYFQFSLPSVPDILDRATEAGAIDEDKEASLAELLEELKGYRAPRIQAQFEAAIAALGEKPS